jgi:cyclophilin family peptidyl-prolyl cis-trans isomerase/HEAT repeat protein
MLLACRNMRPFLYFILFLAALAPFGCEPVPDVNDSVKLGAIELDLRDDGVRRLYDLRDRRQTDSLVLYLKHQDPALRYLAALSFASVRDTLAIDALAPLLQDPVEDVRIAAAFALGQTGSARAEPLLISAFDSRDSNSLHQRFNATVLEAIGKCGTRASLRHLAAVTTYEPTDTMLLLGLCRAIYRFSLRDSLEPAATALMIDYMTNTRIPERARVMAAHYFARNRNVVVDSAQMARLAPTILRTENPDIRMALARGIGNTKNRPAFDMISKVILNPQDWRVRCNLINALAGHRYDTVRSLVVPLVLDTNPHVARTAAEFFIANGQAKDGDFYWRIARDNPNLHWSARAALYHASNKWLSSREEPEQKEYVSFRLKEIFGQSANPYERAACLHALAENGWQYRWIHERGFRDPHPAVKTAALQALNTILNRRDFYAFFGEGARGVRRELYLYLREAVASGDPGMIAEAAPGFQIPLLNFRSMRDSLRLPNFYSALQALQLPRDYEAHAALSKAIAYFEGRPAPVPARLAYNHPIDWARLTVLTPGSEVILHTVRGDVVLELFPHWAPGSVANFLELAGTGFFNGKNFHRVVPNFVIQGGDPRGDGYGALPYSLRTEIGLVRYDQEGMLGMASAGPDTEGTQFFITHSPTPHLDGTYTIFGRVLRGMDVVHRIQPGDVINSVTLEFK